jgi:hypothetical protein
MQYEKNIQIIGGINQVEDTWRKDYEMLIRSGMAWEFHPWLTGNWNEDKERYIKEIVNSYANTEN